MPKDRSKESHHFVPQFYLRHWCGEDGQLWVSSKLNNPKPFKTSPKSVAAQKGLYDSSGTRFSDFDYELKLSEIESLYAPRWPKIFDSMADPTTKAHLSRFLALMMLRNPRQKERVRKVNELYGKIADEASSAKVMFIDTNGSQSLIDVNELRHYAANTDGVLHDGFLNGLRATLQSHSEAIQRRIWGLIFTDKPTFITSDNPVVIRRGTCELPAFGLRTPGTEITFPISPMQLLVISDSHDEDGLHYPLIRMGDWNAIRREHADRFTFSWDARSLACSPHLPKAETSR